jgi:hypothetical protein
MRIILVIPPGHFRDSLVALLRTLPDLQLACLDWSNALHAMPGLAAPHLLVVDVDRAPARRSLEVLKARWPQARILALCERAWMAEKDALDYVEARLPRSLSAGDFLAIVQGCAHAPRPAGLQAEPASRVVSEVS